MSPVFRTVLNSLALLGFLAASPAFAYIGPGLGAGTVGVILGVLGSILLAIFAIVGYPIKRLLKKRKNPGKSDEKQQPDGKQDARPDGESET